MTEINIVYLPYRRWHFSELTLLLFSKCNFKDFHITVCGMGHHAPDCERICDEAKNKYGLSASPLIVHSSYTNYIDKLKLCVDMNYKYSVKLDEDIFMSPGVWDYLFSNVNMLDDDQNLFLAPTLSSGIPSCDLFIKHNLTPEQQNHMIKLFSDTRFSSAVGVNYSGLNKSLINGYNENVFWDAVSKFNHFYKGIHPIRVDFNAQSQLNNYIIQNISRFFEDREFFVEELNRPYFCNSVFAIKTDAWKNVVNDQSQYVDNFDEVPLNRYKTNHNKKMLFISNAFAIHTLYNTLVEFVGENVVSKNEEELFQALLNKFKSIYINA